MFLIERYAFVELAGFPSVSTMAPRLPLSVWCSSTGVPVSLVVFLSAQCRVFPISRHSIIGVAATNVVVTNPDLLAGTGTNLFTYNPLPRA